MKVKEYKLKRKFSVLQWTGTNLDEISDFLNVEKGNYDNDIFSWTVAEGLILKKDTGIRMPINSYIMVGVEGNITSLKEEDLELHFEEVPKLNIVEI